jgi:hypothetical protein
MLGMGYATEALHLPGISKRCVVCITSSSIDICSIFLYSFLMVAVYVLQVGV